MIIFMLVRGDRVNKIPMTNLKKYKNKKPIPKTIANAEIKKKQILSRVHAFSINDPLKKRACTWKRTFNHPCNNDVK